MPHVLLLIQQRGNRQLLESLLSRNYDVSVGESEMDLDQPFDLAILDAPMLARLRPQLHARKSAELPVHLPFLLITSRQDTGSITRDLMTVVDELILAPIDRIELQARVGVQLRVRKDSLDLKRQNDVLEDFIAELTSAFEVATDETQLTEILLEHALRIAGGESGGVLLDGDQPRLTSSRGVDPAEPGLMLSLERLLQQTNSTDKSGQLILEEPADAAPQVMLPIRVKGELAGALILPQPATQWDQSERTLLNSLCAQAGVFLHNLRQAHRLVEAAQLYHQLELAEAVQQQLLPAPLNSIDGLDMAATYQSTNRVGGDYYDIVELGPRQVAAVIADVAGHSLSSGLVMTSARSAFRVLLQREKQPAEVMEQLNAALYADLEQTGLFISMCLVVVDLDTMTATYTNAGHCSPIISRNGLEEPISLESPGIPLGILPDPGYTEDCVPLHSGDKIVLYTDGVTESRNEAGEFLGEQGLLNCIKASPGEDAETISDTVVRTARSYSRGESLDDLTVLVLSLNGRQ